MERVDIMSVTEEQKKIMESEDTRKIVYVSFPNKELPIIKNNRIYQESMTLQESLLDASDFTFGKCNTSLFQIKVADFEDDIDGAYIDVSIMFENATLGNYEHVLGNYIISSTDRTSDKRFRIISANDYMTLFEKDVTNWFNNTLFPTDIITNHLGWILEDSNGNKINVTYNKDSAPKTSKIETDDGKYYLDNTTGYVYVGKANYKSKKFVNVTWSKVVECKENVSYTESAETERTINEILQMLCAEVGVEYDNEFPLVNGSLVIKKNFKPETLNAKDLLEQICEANGVFGHFFGKKLCFIAPNKNNPISEISNYKECDFQDYDVKRINSLQIKTDDEDVGVTVTRENIEKINKYTITGNVLFYGITENLEQIAENILSVIENVEYRPNDTTVSNNIDLNVGDCVTVNARISSESGIKSNPFTTIVMQKQISGIQSLYTSISANGDEYQSEAQTSLSSQISILDNAQREITRSLTALTADFNQLYANKIDVENLVANVAAIDHLDANSAIVDTLKSQVITTEYIKSATADLGYLTADSAVIKGKLDANQLSAEVAKLGYLTADSAVITGKLDTNQLSAEVAKLGYAKVDFSNVGSQVVDSSMIKDGAVTNEKVANLSANKITSGTIDASKINVTNLNADNLTVGTINGQRIGNGSLSLDKLAEEVPTKEYLDNVEKNLQGQIDGAIETFTKSEIPTLNNEPANAWTDNDTRKKHIGDICYVVNPTSSADGYCYRFADLGTNESPNYSWVLIKDSDVTKALQDIIDINGEITGIKRFDSEISAWKVDTDSELSSLKTRTTTLETEMGDKVSTSTFNEVKQTVDSNSSTITKMSETVTNVSNVANTANSTANNALEKIDGLEIGGRNLIKPSLVGHNIEKNTGYYDAKLPCVDNSDTFLFLYYYKKLEVGETYTLSCKVSGVKDGTEWSFGLFYSGSNDQFLINKNGKTSVTFVMTNDYNSNSHYINGAILLDDLSRKWGAGQQGNPIILSEFKLEKGNKATDWTPAPEDMATQESLQTVSNTVNEVKQTADSNSSTISSMQTVISNKADSSTVESISKRTSSLEQDLSGFKITVSNTYSTKGEVTEVSSVASQTANKISWLVKSGTSASNFELTDRVATLVADNINVNGRVTFSGLSTDAQSKINNASTDASSALKTANGIKSNIYTANTTTIDGGKITTGSITAKQINVSDLFAQNISATGTITGATLKGAHVEADSGYIGNWGIASGAITNNYEYYAGSDTSTDNFTRKTSFGSDGTISITKNFYNMSAVESFEVSGSLIKLGQGNEWCQLNPQGIYFGYDSTNTSYISEEGIMESGKMLSEKYLTKFVSVNYTYASVSVPANGTKSVTPTKTNIPSGYTAIGIKQLNGGSGAVIFRGFAMNGTINLINRSSSAVTCTPTMTVVCVKNQFIG